MGDRNGYVRPDEVTPLPLRKITVLGLILLANNASIWMIFSFLPFMIMHFFEGLSKSEVGYRAGILGSAFSFGSLFGNFIWGVTSDKIGRRPVLLMGLVGTAVSAALFGFAPSFWVAVLARFLWGLLNGNIGIAKTYIAEISDDTNSARGMALFGIIGGIGRTVGPVVGGFLSEPAKRYSSLRGTLFEEYPFSLPSIVIVAMCALVFFTAYFELPETLHTLQRKTVKHHNQKREYQPLDATDLETSIDIETSIHDLDDKQHGMELQPIESEEAIVPSGSRWSPYTKVSQVDAVAISPLTNTLLTSASSTSLDNYPRKGKRRVSFNSTVEIKVMDTSDIAKYPLKQISEDDCPIDFTPDRSSVRYSNGSELVDGIEHDPFYVTVVKLLRVRPIFLSTVLYGLVSFIQVILFEVFPLWLVIKPKEGGFGFTSHEIGLAIMICGPITIFFQLVVYPYLTHQNGVLKTFRIGVIIFAVAAGLIPVVTMRRDPHINIVQWIYMVLMFTAMNIGAQFALISVFVMINNACYSHQRGTVNGIGQTFASTGRLLGPYVGASIFAWSANNGHGWPIDYSLVWNLIGLMAIYISCLSCKLPKKIQRRKREPKNPRYALTMMSKEHNDDEEEVIELSRTHARDRLGSDELL